LTLQYDKVVFLLEPNEITRELRRKRVTVVDYPDGRLAIRYRGLDLPYTSFDKLRQVSQATIVENKHLGAVLAHIRERQIERAEARSRSAPRRQGQVGHMLTASTILSLSVPILRDGQDAVKPGLRPPPPAAAGLTAPRPPQLVPPRDQ
jgi:hypothetical protein